MLGPGDDGKAIAPEGVRVSTFTAAQRAMLVDVVGEWVGILSDEAAAAKMKEVKAGLAETYFAWAGSTTNGSGAYFRIQGPTVLIEYAPQGSGARATPITFTRSTAIQPTTTRRRRLPVRRALAASIASRCCPRVGRPPARRVSAGDAGVVARDRIALEVDLTPGANIASQIASLDRDGDRAISRARPVIRTGGLDDLALEPDGRPVSLTLTRVEVPTIGEMRDGMGAIRLQATASIDGFVAGRRNLHLQNDHQPEKSVDPANVLVPDTADVRIVSQSRASCASATSQSNTPSSRDGR